MNRVLLGILCGILLMHGYATRAGPVRQDTPANVPAAICRRILMAQSLYGFGALLCVVNACWSIAFIVLVRDRLEVHEEK